MTLNCRLCGKRQCVFGNNKDIIIKETRFPKCPETIEDIQKHLREAVSQW